MISKWRIMFFICGLCVSCVGGWLGFQRPNDFIEIVELTATIISILVGLSLALLAVLSTSVEISKEEVRRGSFSQRVAEIARRDDGFLIDGQYALFWVYYLTLISAMAARWVLNEPMEEINIITRLIYGAFSFLSCFSLFLSSLLPSLIHAVARQRKSMGK